MLESVRQVWGLQKDETIKHLLILLFDHFGEGGLVVNGDEQCHERAISLMHRHDPAVRVYVYTYGHAAGRYGVHVEYPLVAPPFPLNYPVSFEDVSFEHLAEIIELNLNIIPTELSD